MSRIRLILIPPSAALPASCLTLEGYGPVRQLFVVGGGR